MDIDKMRQMHNDFLDDYFESLDKERIDREGEEPRFVEDTNASEVHTFQEFVAFLNLIKNDDVISKGWDIYMKRFDKDFGHYASECPEKNKNKDQGKYLPYKEPSTSRISDKEGSNGSTSDDYIIIT
uniref:Bulb-type lectin domain-containing protein n=1 Tax=Tanacetum cinerariifolium TaxID=118510 RepID=A0A6L2LDD4_TANCI|nr:bulb-type lectin domain-containing protein [Tanacetum cinerariifolium]